MVELIDKKNLFNNLFVRNGKVFPNNDIDNFPTTIDVKEVKKAILEQPTTTEAEIRAKAYDRFAEKLKTELAEENWINVGYRCTFERMITEIAEQLKDE